ncbi:hypothetical protein B0T20DRAFT_474361 [Sordaria brevicollis]|uniref:Uncharacterized protein n=1 Tax=Sordaria brevicollis TaxID=83679 RepID=A0AAE0PMZ0_SORBR|nr:hypothetical protein B0T20DRAFT_474361 [Sordaria brevicollis]
MESPTKRTSPERASSPIREASPVREGTQAKEEEAMETSPFVQYDEGSDSPKEQIPPDSTDETAADETSAFDYKYDSDFEKDLAGSTSPIRGDSPVMGDSPVIESSNPPWNDRDSDKGSVPPSPGRYEEVTTEEAPASYEEYSKYDSDHQDETVSPVASTEEGATGKTYGVQDFDESVPPSPGEEYTPGKAFSVPLSSDDDSAPEFSSFSPTAGREEQPSAEKETIGLMNLSDVEDDAADPPRTPPRTFSDEERESRSTSRKLYEPITPESIRRSARKQAYSRYSSDESDDSEWGTGPSVRPGRKDSDPFVDKTPAPSASEDPLSARNVNKEGPPPSTGKPAGTARPDVPPVEIPEWEEGMSEEEWDSGYDQSPNSPATIFRVPLWAWRAWWPFMMMVLAKRLLRENFNVWFGGVFKRTRETINRTREKIGRTKVEIAKEILYLQSYHEPTHLTAAQEREAAESAAMPSTLFLITLYIVLVSIVCRLVAISNLPFLSRFVF